MIKKCFFIFFVAANVVSTTFFISAKSVAPVRLGVIVSEKNERRYVDSAGMGFVSVLLANTAGLLAGLSLLAFDKRARGCPEGLYAISDVVRQATLLSLLVIMGSNEGGYSGENALAFLVGTFVSIASPMLGGLVALFSFISKRPPKPRLAIYESDVQK